MSKPDLRVGEEEVGLVEPASGTGSSPPTNGDGSVESVESVESVLPGEAAVARAARASLEGRTRGVPRLWPFLVDGLPGRSPRTRGR